MDQQPPEPAASPRRPPRRLIVASVLSAVALLVTGILAFGDDDADHDAQDTPELSLQPGEPLGDGEPVPTMSLTTFDDEKISLADFEGRPVVVNFFASWCAPCVAEMPEIENVHQELGDDVHFLGVSFNEPRADSERIVEQTGVTYPIVEDPDGALFEAFGASAMPTTVFITADGRVDGLRSGRITEDQLRERLQRLLG